MYLTYLPLLFMAFLMTDISKTAAFARTLGFLMRRAGISGKELSAEIGVPASTISRWRSGARLPHKSKIILVSDYFGVRPDSMTNGMIPIPVTRLIIDENSSNGEVRNRCVAHIGAFLQVAGNHPGGIEWTWTELQRRFPLDKWDREC
ncbi:MAG: helix-turn-helix domain-containing protein [Opitutaceae bacterium]